MFSPDRQSFTSVVTDSDLPEIITSFFHDHERRPVRVIAVVNHGRFTTSALPSVPLSGPDQPLEERGARPDPTSPPSEPLVLAIYLFYDDTQGRS